MQAIRDSFRDNHTLRVNVQIERQLQLFHTELAKTLREEGIKHNVFGPLCTFYDIYGSNIEIEESMTMIYSLIDHKHFDIFKFILKNNTMFIFEREGEQIFNYCVKNKLPEFAKFLLSSKIYDVEGEELAKKQLTIRLLEVDSGEN